MTYPSGAGVITNNYGPALPNTGATAEPVYPPTATPQPVGEITVLQDPTGVISGPQTIETIVDGAPGVLTYEQSPSSWEYENSELAAAAYTAAMVAAQSDGTPFNFQGGTVPQPTGYNVDETTPNPPSGDYAQEGTPAISNITSITASFGGIDPASIQVFRWE
jgi:hypothetical protein